MTGVETFLVGSAAGVGGTGLTAGVIGAGGLVGGASGISLGALTAGLGFATSAVGLIRGANAAEQDATTRLALSRQEADEFRRNTSRLLATQRARSGASGTVAGTGTNLDLAEDTAAEAEFQRLKILSGGKADASRLERRATGKRIRAGATLLRGAGQTFGTA